MMNSPPLRKDEYAWRPHNLLSNYSVWHYWDIPLIGVFQYESRWWVFCADGDVGDDNMDWLYYNISNKEKEAMPTLFDSANDFDVWLLDLLKGKYCYRAQTVADKLVSWKEDRNL